MPVTAEEGEEKMKIEHIAMYVEDLDRARAFFETYFEARSNDGYYNKSTGFRSFFLSFQDGARLELMKKPLVEKRQKEAKETGYAHLAFSVGSREKVDELTDRLKQDGYEVLSGPRTTGDGYYESCIRGPEGNRIEITI